MSRRDPEFRFPCQTRTFYRDKKPTRFGVDGLVCRVAIVAVVIALACQWLEVLK